MTESLRDVLRGTGGLVPGALGIQEGGLVLVRALSGIPADQAIVLCLLPRLRDIALGLPGPVVWRRVSRARVTGRPGLSRPFLLRVTRTRR